MLQHWSQVVPWLLAACSLLYAISRNRSQDDKEREKRIQMLEVNLITQKLEHQNQLDLVKEKLSSVQLAVQTVNTLLTQALKDGN